MDKKSRDFQSKCPKNLRPNTSPWFLPDQIAVLRIMGKLMVGDLAQQIKIYRHGPIMEKYIQSSLQDRSKSLQINDWKAIEIALVKMDTIRRISRTKIIHKIWTTNVVMQQRSKERPPTCLS